MLKFDFVCSKCGRKPPEILSFHLGPPVICGLCDPEADALPGPGEHKQKALPDSFDGIRFEIGRMVKYVLDGHKDPIVISTAHKIAALAADTARQLGQEVTEETRGLIHLKGIHAWCHANFEYVPNPVSVELLKTPQRMLRELEIPEMLSKAMWEPIRDRMAKEAGKSAELQLPKPKITGNVAPATTLVLALAAAVGIAPLRMRFGGTGGTLHYVWGNAQTNGLPCHDVDVLLPALGDFRVFEQYELVEIPL